MGGLFSSIKNKKKARQTLENEPSSQTMTTQDGMQSRTTDTGTPLAVPPLTGIPSPKTARHHPYDEITDTDLLNNRMARGEERQSHDLGKADPALPLKANGHSTHNDVSTDRAAGTDDVYTQVNKPKKSNQNERPSSPESSLNYIQVEILPSSRQSQPATSAGAGDVTHKPSIPRDNSPCTYTEILHTNGQFVMLSE